MKKGIPLLLGSAISIALATVFAKLITDNSDVHGIEISFFRFTLGFIAVTSYMLVKGSPFRPNRARYILLRAVFNTLAVLFFYTGIQYTTVTNANMINMTYPVIVFMAAPFINREKSRFRHYVFLGLTILGVYLVAVPDFKGINQGDIYTIISSIAAGVAISSLREARKYDSSAIIIFYLMVLGSLISLILVIPIFIMPDLIIMIYILVSVFFALLGQVLITVGFRYIDATPGSLVSASRIVFGGILGISLFSDPISLQIVLGGVMILISLAGVSEIWKRVNNQNSKSPADA